MFMQSAHAAGNSAAAQGSPLAPLLMMGGFFLICYFLLLRPQQKRQKEHREMVNHLEKGDEVVTSGGLLGKITKITDDFIAISIANGVEIKIQKQAVTSTLPKGTIKAIN